MEAELPLLGVKVLDLTRLLPGPYATLVMADLGATVDKIEDPQGGDYIRQMPPLRDDVSGLFYALNRNKRSVVLDLRTPQGVAALRRLARGYDVLIESFRPGVMDKLGLSYAALAEENPRLVYCSVSGYGQTGPDRLKAGHDLNYIARAGALGLGGPRGAAPATPGVQMADLGGSLFSLVGILAALHARHRTGRGRQLDISMTETAFAYLHMHLGARLYMDEEGTPLERGTGALNGGYACYRVYRTSDDRYLSVGALEPKFFSGLLAKLERPELFAAGYDTGEEGLRAQRELETLFASKPQAHWLELLREADVCVEPVLEGDDVLRDPQHQARGLFVRALDPALGREVTQLRTPVASGASPLRPPPALGQHTREVLGEAGFTAEELGALGV